VRLVRERRIRYARLGTVQFSAIRNRRADPPRVWYKKLEELMAIPAKPEQRHWSRVKLSCLVRARPSQPTVEEFDEVLATVNSCRGGFYFATDSARYKKHLRLFVTFPYSDALGAINRDYIGEVVRVDDLPDGGKGIAVNLLTTIGLAIQNQLSTFASDTSARAWTHRA
jgi:hypothetical protein